ncbi:MAG TPA: aminopeptidase [Miltoncostaeaceae bacterium]|nr:aminopeptidase [Miltoncostaeaceae bacterium]
MGPEDLARYAERVLRDAVAFRPGDTLIADGETAHRELLVALAEAAYRGGARHVEIRYTDRRVQLAKLLDGTDDALGVVTPWDERRLRGTLDPRTAVVHVSGEEEPGLLAKVDPARTSTDYARRAKQLRWYLNAIVEHRVRWTIVAWPTAAWARRVYPELARTEAQRRLAADLLSFCRLGPGDGEDGWSRHARRLERRVAALNRRRFTGLELRGPGTSLDIALVPGARWMGGGEVTTHGARIYPNFPTEEVFTSPDPRGTEGTFRCTKPLSFAGRLIEDIAGTFRRGRLTEISARKAGDRDLLERTMSTDRGAGRLGEIALVDRASRIGQTGRVYWDTLLDENAASHMAFGDGFAHTRLDGQPRVNRSAVHLDVMIGSAEVEVIGLGARGRRVPVLAGGEWRLPE